MSSPTNGGRSATEPQTSTRAFAAAAAVFWIPISLALRAVAILHYKINSDESQHLHIAWGWTRGLRQYGDVFDNHMPLFHLLYAPLVAVVGERADIIFWMRLSMLPLLAGTLAATYYIGARLYSKTVGIWSAALLSILTGFLLSSTEFRTDNLWTMLWMLALVIIVSGRVTRTRAAVAGVVVGLCFLVSLKSVLLLGALVVGVVSAIEYRNVTRRDLQLPGLFLAGAVAPLVGAAAWFYRSGLWNQFVYCTVGHNLLPQLGNARRPERALIALFVIPLLVVLSRRLFKGSGDIDRRPPLRQFLLVTAVSYLVLLVSFWPLIPRQDYLPAYPMAVICLVALVLQLRFPLGTVVLSLLCLLSLFSFWDLRLFQVDETAPQTSLLRDVLRLSGPADMVMDTKGETVFRTRVFYYALETITSQRILRGLITDDIAQRIIRSRTCIVSQDSGRYPPKAREFLNAHFISVGTLRVPGKLFDRAGRAVFDVPFDARYSVVSPNSDVCSGILDGSPYEGSRLLKAGLHEFVSSSPTTFAIVWSKAVEKGFSPFRAVSAPHESVRIVDAGLDGAPIR